VHEKAFENVEPSDPKFFMVQCHAIGKAAQRKLLEYLNGQMWYDSDYDMMRIPAKEWYANWEHWANFLERNPSTAEILYEVFQQVENCRGHGRAFIATASYQCLEMIIRDLEKRSKK
jgi:hypothetical protein